MDKNRKSNNEKPVLKPGDICIYDNECSKFNFKNDIKEAIENAMLKEN